MAEITQGFKCRGAGCIYHSSPQDPDGCSYTYHKDMTRTVQLYEQYNIKYPNKEQREALSNAPCPFYEKGKAGPRMPGTFPQRKSSQPRKHDWDSFQRLHAAGMTDRQLGESLGMSRCAAGALRRKMGLSPNPGEPRKKYDYERLRQLHAAGMNDMEIMAEMGIKTVKTVCNIRNRLGLKVNQSEPRQKYDHDTMRRLHAAGLTDREIMAEMGITSAKAVYELRYRMGLGANFKGKKR